MRAVQYIVIPNALSTELCEKTIELGDNLELRYATTDGGEDSYTAHVRNSSVEWFIEDNFDNAKDKETMVEVYDAVDGCFNRALADWAMDDIQIVDRQPYQYTNYRKGQYYDWHRDSREEPYDTNEYTGLQRKFSLSVLLNPVDEYEGGNFEIETNWHHGPHENWNRVVTFDPNNYDIGQGTVIIFWSHLYHRVAPVKKGIRKSLVAWYLGPPFV